jgi:hypothetical protein
MTNVKNDFCQAQPKLQVKLDAELALFPFDPATPSKTQPTPNCESLLLSSAQAQASAGMSLLYFHFQTTHPPHNPHSLRNKPGQVRKYLEVKKRGF